MADEDIQPDLTAFNVIASTILTLFGMYVLYYLIPGYIPVPEGIDQGLSARFMPTVAIGALTFFSFLLGLNIFIRKVRGLGPIPEDNEDNEEQGFGLRELTNTLLLLFGSALYVAMLSTVGFVLASSFGLMVSLYLGKVRNWILIAVVSIGIPLALSQLLWWGLTIQLPAFQLFK